MKPIKQLALGAMTAAVLGMTACGAAPETLETKFGNVAIGGGG